MAGSRFDYVTYIRVSPDRLWQALTRADDIKAYFFGVTFDSQWEQGAAWRMYLADGTLCNSGEILEFTPPSTLVLSWRHDMSEERRREGPSRVSFTIEPVGEACRLTLSQVIDLEDSKVIASGAEFWPQILSNLKSFLETGRPAV